LDWFAADPRRHLLIVIDQLEELITLCAPEVREGFLRFLAGLLEGEKARLQIVATLRSDFEPQFADSAIKRHIESSEGLGGRLVVPPLRHDELREIIEKPAGERVLFFEPPSLVERLIEDVNNMPGALPLLSFALSELYLAYIERQREAQCEGAVIDRTITEEDYRKLGGVVGALSRRATEEYDACDAAHQATMRRVMLRMVATEGELARRRVPCEEMIYPRPEETERARAVVERLRAARLVVSGRADGDATDDDGGDYIEPAHDALVRAWGKLLDWRREATANLPVLRRLTEAAAEWTRRQRDSGLLWTSDPGLPLVRQHLTASDNALNQLETQFVQASVRRKQRNERLRWGGAITVPVFLIAVIVFIGHQWKKTEEERRLATARELTTHSVNNLSIDPELSVLLAIEAAETTYAVDGTALEEAQDVLVRAINAPRPQLTGSGNDELRAVAFSPDGKLLGTASNDGTATLWDAASGEHVRTLVSNGKEGKKGWRALHDRSVSDCQDV
jgi:hypothetical protein